MQKTAVRWAVYAVALIAAFLIGFVPMWMQASKSAVETAKTQTQLRKAEVANLLTSAIVESRIGEYEPARQKTSDFFTRLQAEIDKGDDGFLTSDQRSKIGPIFLSRDALITLLAQRDQASADRLTDIYTSYQTAIGIKPVTPAPTAANTAVNANVATP